MSKSGIAEQIQSKANDVKSSIEHDKGNHAESNTLRQKSEAQRKAWLAQQSKHSSEEADHSHDEEAQDVQRRYGEASKADTSRYMAEENKRASES